MNSYQCIVADLAYYEDERCVKVNVDILDDNVKMSCEVDVIRFSVSGEFYFETFQLLRDRLLELGYGIKCNGSKLNAIQSGLFGNSEKIYLVENGKQAMNKDLYSIWDYADIRDFPSTNEQRAYAKQWFKSLEAKIPFDHCQ